MAFPQGEAGAPSEASRRQPEISNSRASSSHTAQRGRLPFAANQRRGATRSSLSARGSSRAPQLLPLPARRAIQPSSASVMPPTSSSSQAMAWWLAISASTRGRPATARIKVSRSAQMRQWMFNLRMGYWFASHGAPADTPWWQGLSESHAVPVGCRIDVDGGLTLPIQSFARC